MYAPIDYLRKYSSIRNSLFRDLLRNLRLYSRSLLHDLRSSQMRPPRLLHTLNTTEPKTRILHTRLAVLLPITFQTLPPSPRNARHRILHSRNGLLPDAHPSRGAETKCANGQQRPIRPAKSANPNHDQQQRHSHAPSPVQIQETPVAPLERIHSASRPQSPFYGAAVSAA